MGGETSGLFVFDSDSRVEESLDRKAMPLPPVPLVDVLGATPNATGTQVRGDGTPQSQQGVSLLNLPGAKIEGCYPPSAKDNP